MSDEFKQETIEEVLDSIKCMFEEVRDLLRDETTRHGIHIDKLPEVEVERVPFDRDEQELVDWCVQYSELVSGYLVNYHPELPIMGPFWEPDHYRIHDDTGGESEHLQVLDYYQFFLQSKCVRALTRYADEDRSEIQSDRNGTAKVLLLSCEECIAALQSLYSIGSDNDYIIDMLGLLQKIIARVESLFPNARSFVRPGFDE